MDESIGLRVRVSVVAVLALLAGPAASARADDDRRDAEESRVRIGYEVAPVPLKLRGLDRGLVGLGSYLVNAAGACVDCHSHPAFVAGGDPYFGQGEAVNAAQYLSGGRQFGPFVSPNLTPDANGRPGGLTREQFVEVMRTGRDPDGSNRLLQVMPWPFYAKMSRTDLRAIYEYLRAVPPLPQNPQPGP